MREIIFVKLFGFELFVGWTERTLPWKWYGDGLQFRRLALNWGAPRGARAA